MKFTKEDANKELVAKMTAKGEKLNLSERSLNEQLDTLIPLLANEETELADFVSKVLPIFKTADANVRNDVSAGINDYKKQNPAPTQDPNKKVDSNPNDALEARLHALEEQLANAEKAKKVASIKKDIAFKLKEKGVKNAEWANSLLDEINITEDVDVDSKVESLLSLYNKVVATGDPNATPGAAGGGNPNKDLEEAIKAASAIAASQRLDAND